MALPKGNSVVSTNVATTGQVGELLSDDTLKYYTYMYNNISELQLMGVSIGNSVSDFYELYEKEQEKWNNYIDFILDPTLNTIKTSLNVLSDFIIKLSKGQEPFIKDYFKNENLEGELIESKEEIFRSTLLGYLTDIKNTIFNEKNNNNPNINNNINSVIEANKNNTPLNNKFDKKSVANEIGKDSKDFKNISQNIDGILNSFTNIIKKYADSKDFKKIDKVKKNLTHLVLSLENILYDINDILSGLNEEQLKNIILFNSVTSSMTKSIDSLVNLIETLNTEVGIKNTIKAHIVILGISNIYDEISKFMLHILSTEIDWKAGYEKTKLIEKALDPLFDILDTITLRKSLKDIIKTYMFLFTIETIVNKTIKLIDIISTSKIENNDEKIEKIISTLNSLEDIVDTLVSMNLISAYITTLYAGRVFEEIIKSINDMGNSANKISNLEPLFLSAAETITLISRSFIPLIKLSLFSNRTQTGALVFSELVSLIVYTFNNIKVPKKIINNAKNINDMLPYYTTILGSIVKLIPGLLGINIFNKILRKGIDNLDDILIISTAVFINPLFTTKVNKNIKDTNKGLNEIINIFMPLVKLGILYLDIILFEKLYTKGINSLDNILTKIVGVFNEKELISKDSIKQIKDVKNFISTLASLTYSLILIGIGMLVLIPMLPIITLGLLGIKLILMLTNVLFSGESMKELRANINSFSRSLLLITASFLLFSITMLVLSNIIMSGELVLGTLMFFGYITAVIGFMWLLEKFSKDVRKGCISLILTSMSMIAVALSLLVVSKLVSSINYDGMLSFMFYTAIIVGIAALIGMLKSQVLIGSLIVVALSITLMILSASMLAVSTMMENVKFGNLMMLLGATVVFGLIFALIGIPVVAGLVALGAGVIILMSIALMVLAKSIKDLNNIMLGVSEKDVDRICSNFNTYLTRISWTFVKAMPKLLLAMPGLISAMMLGKAVSNLALGIQSFANLNIPIAWDENGKPTAFRKMNSGDFIEASNNIALILTTITEPLAAFGGYTDTQMFNRKKMRAIKKGIKLAGRLGESVSNIASGIQDMAMLKMPTEFDENGKPKKWRNLNNTDFENAANNTSLILTTLANPLADFGGNVDDAGNFQRGKYRAIKKGIKAAGNLGESIGNLASGIRMMAELKMPDYDASTGRIIEGKFRTLTTTDFQNVAINIDTILNCFTNAMEEWIDKHPTYLDGSWLKKSKAGKSIKIVSQIGTTIANLATGIQAMADLKVAKYDETGKIVGYEQINIDEKKIKDNISSILNIVISIFDSYSEKEKELKKGSKIIEKLESPINKISSIISIFSNMPDLDDKKIIAVQSINSVIRKELEYYNSGSAAYLKGLDVMSKAIPSFETLLKIDDFSDKGIKNFTTANKDFEKFVNNSNKIKLEPVRAMTQMLDKLNSLVKSAGSMDNLATALGEKIAPILKELVETLLKLEQKSNSVKNTNELNTTNTNNNMNNNTPNNTNNIQPQNNKDNNSMSDLITKIGGLVSSIENGLNVRVQGDVSIKNSNSGGPIRVQG